MPMDRGQARTVATHLLKGIAPLLEPIDEPMDSFRGVLHAALRRNSSTLEAIVFLTQRYELGESASDLARSMVEDMVSVEWMIASDKEAMAAQFARYLAVQEHQNIEFVRSTGQDPDALGLDTARIERAYQAVRKEFLFYRGKGVEEDRRSWAGKDIDTMILELKDKKALDETDLRLIGISYAFGSRANHFNPLGVFTFYSEETKRMSARNSSRQSVVTGIVCLTRLATRFIDATREKTGKNDHESVARVVHEVTGRLTARD